MVKKLDKLRKDAPAPAAIFSNNVNSNVSEVFARVQSGKPATNQNKKKWKPSRFWCAKGETKRLVILDDKISYAQAEHSVKLYSPENPKGEWQTERCIAAVDACPICSLPKHNPHDVVLLTVLDLTPWSYTDKEGNKVEKEFTKRELAIKTASFPLFQTLASSQGGELRGLVLDMTRGNGDKEAAIGVPTFVMKMTEEDLVETFGHDEIKNDEGRVVKQANQDIMPFDYDKVHEFPSRAELARKYGIAPRPGSVEELAEDATETTTDDDPPFETSVDLMKLDEELPEVE